MRKNGILMPVFSLPSPYGIGTFGRAAFDFIDFLHKAKQSYWQILPLNPTNFGDSPYQSFSSFAGNPYFIDLDLLEKDGLLTASEIKAFDFGDDRESINYEKLYNNRFKILKLAFGRFEPDDEYRKFECENSHWLEGYSLFMAIKSTNDGK
ncbi:MAG: 4-alpha-glucanotransferase, partial [Clostridia bacterium]|nr:4-alpha-glucanotransferase [Clostridia bacterium]